MRPCRFDLEPEERMNFVKVWFKAGLSFLGPMTTTDHGG